MHRAVAATSTKPAFDLRIVFLVGYLLTLVFEGPLRMALSLAKVETILYLRDAFALATIVWVSFKGQPGRSQNINLTALVLFLMVCHFLIGFWLGHPIFSLIFGFKIFISFMFGIACSDLVLKRDKWISRLAVSFLVATALGVVVNYFVGQFPWEGMEFDSAFGVSRNSYIWWAGGDRRLPGFARMSFSAAMILGICGAFVIFQYRSWWVKLTSIALAVPAIYLTTSKGVILSYGLVCLVGFLPYGRLKRKTTSILLWVFVALAIISPPLATSFDISPNLMRFVPSFLSSFIDRASSTWPSAIFDMAHWYTAILGQGVGGIGGGLKFGGEFYRYSPIDNIALYCYCTFGVLGLYYFIWAVRQVSLLAWQGGAFGLSLLGVGVVIVGNGVTAHQFEDAFVGIVMGLLVGAIPRDGLMWVFARDSQRTIAGG